MSRPASIRARATAANLEKPEATPVPPDMGEAFDDLMQKYGKHPFGER